jgi:hypothetical protein
MWCGFMRVGGYLIGYICINQVIGGTGLDHHDIAKECGDIK